ncbi:2-hydroxy-3-oxopropionate reductase [Pararhodobacter sp. CCB-MM2]|uniref:2-hydroxy-3-oxopropionate reductase n=1 Tax=Pararhodobacter sp. CCB-MM2 TaxID=1786003 RepID=UPI00083549D3
MKIGFIGLGVMGAPMAANLQKAGHQIVTTLNRSPLPEGLTAEVLANPAAVAGAAEVVILMLPDTPDVERVMRGEAGVLAGLRPGTLVVDMSTISPLVTAELAQATRDAGGAYIDAPVSGGQIGAEQASLTIMAGGAQADFDRALPLFQLMGKNITLVGEVCGAGQTCKLANQIIVALNIEAVAEALVFASKAGCDPAKVREALMGGFASSRILEVHGKRMIDGTFNPGFRMKLHQKDLNLALSSARAIGVSLPNTATAQELMNACAAQGGADRDHSALVQALELMAAHKISG